MTENPNHSKIQDSNNNKKKLMFKSCNHHLRNSNQPQLMDNMDTTESFQITSLEMLMISS